MKIADQYTRNSASQKYHEDFGVSDEMKDLILTTFRDAQNDFFVQSDSEIINSGEIIEVFTKAADRLGYDFKPSELAWIYFVIGLTVKGLQQSQQQSPLASLFERMARQRNTESED